MIQYINRLSFMLNKIMSNEDCTSLKIKVLIQEKIYS